ncbi:MAG: hypothetical protein FJX76_20535, partial [Armatimonadetes bacterium]|nr:hypothetical protein [Armatimonadota bacterium]
MKMRLSRWAVMALFLSFVSSLLAGCGSGMSVGVGDSGGGTVTGTSAPGGAESASAPGTTTRRSALAPQSSSIVYALGYDTNGDKVLYAYDVTANTWTRKANTGTQNQHLITAVNGKLYAIDAFRNAADRVGTYDPATDQWDWNSVAQPP